MSDSANTPTVRGVGFLGAGKYTSRVNGIKTKEYTVWHSMLSRCYSKNYHASAAYGDVTVCEQWFNFQNFAAWFHENYVEGYQLDKDTLVKGNKIYSPDTCVFIPKSANVSAANSGSDTKRLRDPGGVIHSFVVAKDFIEKHGLTQSQVSRLLNGKIGSHKGWTRV